MKGKIKFLKIDFSQYVPYYDLTQYEQYKRFIWLTTVEEVAEA